MKQTTVNEFRDGLNLDLHPLVTPKTVLTDNLNGTFVTYNGNEFCLQNDRGNQKIEYKIGNNKYYVHLNSSYIPIGIKEHNGILYIVSVNGNKTEIGTFPCPDYPNNAGEYEYEESQNLLFQYAPLHVLTNRAALTNINLGYDNTTPVTVDIQDSYDGSVNIILVANEEKPRIINSGFSVLPNNQYKFVNRNQNAFTNIYDSDKIKLDTELIRTSNILTKIDLLGVQAGGQWKGGNYTFYIKFGDGDFNQTDVVAESGIVSIFNGNDGIPSTISGTLLDERTDKMINLRIEGLNPIYSKIYIYFTREYSDSQGFRMTESGMLVDPIEMEDGYLQSIWLTGFEQQRAIDIEELNVDYHTIDWARAETQHSNMLFLGNVGQKETFALYDRLRTKSNGVTAKYSLDNLEPVGFNYVTGGKEYYSVNNIYNKVGYYPGEIYRFGIVYILNDGSKTPVFDVPGWNFQEPIIRNGITTYPEIGKGVCLMPKEEVITSTSIRPIYLTFTIPTINEPDVIGWFIVRQKRIPNTICEGLSIATDTISNTPMMWDGENWISQSFLAADRENSADTVQLEYNSVQKDIEIDTTQQQTFSEWRESKGYSYLEEYWKDLNEQGDQYSVPGTFVWDENWTSHVAIVNAVTAIVNTLDLDRDFTVYTFKTENGNDTEEQESWESQLQDLHQGTVALRWYQKYELVSVIDDVPTDGPTTEYLVGIVPYLTDAKDKHGNIVEVSTGNINYYNAWKRTYDRMYNNGDLDRKFIKNTLSFSKESNSLLSLDPCVNTTVSNKLDGSKYEVSLEREVIVNSKDEAGHYQSVFSTPIKDGKTPTEFNTKCVFIPSNTGVKVVDDYEFSNIAGNSNQVKQYKAFTTPSFEGIDIRLSMNDDVLLLQAFDALKLNLDHIKEYLDNTEDPEKKREFYASLYSLVYGTNKNINLLRGLFTPYIGLTNNSDIPFGVYSIKHKNSFNTNDFLVRQQDMSEYYCVSQYTDSHTINVYRGDCFTNTVTMRMIRNFIDNTAPISDFILDPDGWYNFVVSRDREATDEKARVSYEDVNLADVNTADLGYWVTFKCLSSYNLGLRSVDRFHTDEIALLGSPRSFYPLNGASTATGNKMEESFLLNDGLSASVGRKRYNILPEKTPYTRSEFANRIMFSNVNMTDAYTNGYRTFQGVSYKDYDKQYGAITKLLPLGQNLFIVMEHGLGLVPVNPKALMQTTTGEAIHIYGYGVLPNEMTIISQDYGSKYEHSVIRTPIGIYGIDVDAKKIWVFSDKQGFRTFSDMHIETYLKDNLEPLNIEMGKTDIRTHYNAKKGDLMFTWNKINKLTNQIELYSICYNERFDKWITRYDWKPIVSENINDEFYSLNKKYNEPSGNCYIWDHAFDVSYKDTQVSTWYDDNNSFEFEFIVSDPIGISKMFDNLQIISNNVQPDELQITVVGDDYMFKRDEIKFEEDDYEYPRKEYLTHKSSTTSNIHDCTNEKEYNSLNDEVVYKWDWRLHQKAICKFQQLKDIYKYGRRMGNIQYKNGMWFIQIEPLRMQTDTEQQMKEIRIRDKWAKIHIKYSGKDLAIITAIRTLINI